METAWARSLRKRFPWIAILWKGATFFGVLAVATIMVYLIVRVRTGRIRKRWEEEERIWTVVREAETEDEDEPDEEQDWETWH